MTLVPWDLEPEFRAAGWLHGRRVPVPSFVSEHHQAHAVLAELGGLRLMVDHGGYEICEIEFQSLPEKSDLVTHWEEAFDTELVGVGELHNAHGELWMSGGGFLFGNSIVHEAFWLVGNGFAIALINILSKQRDRPMLLREGESVMLYGHRYTWNDPEVLRPSSPEFNPNAGD
jgi:hypothetical protein